MAPITQASDESNHQALLDKLDLYAIPKPFRNTHWKPPQRRNKNVKQIIADASRKEASVMATQNNSGTTTPLLPHSNYETATATPAVATNGMLTTGANSLLAQAAQNLSKLELEKNSQGGGGLGMNGPTVTYTNIEAAPSLHPQSRRRYCDITGLPAPYRDPKSRLLYHNAEVFRLIRTMGQTSTEAYLAARGAHTVLK